MSARARIHAMFTCDADASTAEVEGAEQELNERLNAYRDEVLEEVELEIALAVERNRAEHPNEQAMIIRRLGMRAAERVARGMRKELRGEAAAAATATPDFFQPGRTYTEPDGSTDWRFRCDAITTHPEDGERTALGWRHFRGKWEPYSYGEDDWEIHQFADALGTEGGGL